MNITLKMAGKSQGGGILRTESHWISPGGKAANQALAAGRMGAKTSLIGKVGNDEFGDHITGKLRREGVSTAGVAKSDSVRTGLRIMMDQDFHGVENIISLAANAKAMADQVPDEILNEHTLVLVQNEITPEENAKLIARAKQQGATVIMNLSPSIEITPETLKLLDYLIVNSYETKMLCEKMGIKDVDSDTKLAAALAEVGQLTCIVTQGEEGCLAMSPGKKGIQVPALKLDNFVDKSGADDVWCGTFAACIYADVGLTGALQRANVAASLTCTKEGSQEAFPYSAEVKEALEQIGPASDVSV